MRLLSIETSCDETGVSLIEWKDNKNSLASSFKVIKNLLISQILLHREHGGVWPDLAKREHIKALPLMIQEAMEGFEFTDLDAIAVTYGPGLSPALWVGIEAAKKIAEEYNLPLYPINHMEGHIYASMLEQSKKDEYSFKPINYPAIALLISGGHTELVHINNEHSYKKIGETQDDAVGEAFDKAARAMGYPYPGGPEISKRAKLARKNNSIVRNELRLPRPMLHSHDLNFSFSGLKTAVLYALQKNELDEEEKQAFCMEFENAVTDVLLKKVKDALYLYNAKSLIVGGGVSANAHIREALEKLCKEEDVEILLSEKSLSTDNALMISAIAFAQIQHDIPATNPQEIRATPNLSLSN